MKLVDEYFMTLIDNANSHLENRVLDLKLSLWTLIYFSKRVQHVVWGRVRNTWKNMRNCSTTSSWPFEAIHFPHLQSTDTHASAVLTGTTSVAASHLLPCWYHSGSSLAKINQIWWKALYPLLRCVTDVRQAWLHLSLWRMLGSSTWTNASVPVEAAAIDKHGPICEYTVHHCTCIDKC